METDVETVRKRTDVETDTGNRDGTGYGTGCGNGYGNRDGTGCGTGVETETDMDMKIRRKVSILIVFLMLSGLAACEQEEIDPAKLYQIYYISKTESKVEIHDYVMQAETPGERLTELLGALADASDGQGYKAPLNMGFALLEYELKDGKIRLNLDERYKNLSATTEVLVRGAIVKTLTQLSFINFVEIAIENDILYDSLGMVVGWMSGDQFLNNPGSEINSYEDVRLTLYFANAAGNALVADSRIKPYNGNISMERLVVEELIKGTGTEGRYPAINPNTKIIGITVKDGICYVNLDEAFYNTVSNVLPEVTIYSIVNSLAELSNINKVQFSVDDNITGAFREKISSNTVYQRNLDIVSAITN
jgi:germination protein M